MADDTLFIEQREQGDYAIRRPGSERASAVLPTQRQAIERAGTLNPDTSVGGRDQWRKP